MAAVTQSSDASEPKPTLLIDVLPYADEYDELTQAEVEGLIEQEMRTFAPPNYLADAPEHVIKFQSEIIQREWTKMEESGDYSLPKVINTELFLVHPPPETHKKNQETWIKHLNNAKAQYQSQEHRLDNLELLNQFGANAWIKHNEFLDSRKVKYEAMLDEAQKEVEELNKLRKAEQEEAGAKLYNLQAKFHGHLHKNMQIDNACLQIEADIEKMMLGGTNGASTDAMDTS